MAPIEKQTNTQIKMMNCADLNLSLLTLTILENLSIPQLLNQFLQSCWVAGCWCPYLSTLCWKKRKTDKAVTTFLLMCEIMTKRVRLLTMRKTETEKERLWEKRAAWRMKALFSGVGNQQELDMQRLLAGSRSGSITVYPTGEISAGERVPSGPLHSRHIYPHPSHTFLTYSHDWPVHLPLTLPPFQLMSYFKLQTILIRTKRSDRGKNIKVSSSHRRSLIVHICMFLSNVQFVAKIFLFSRESISPLTVTDRSYTCTLAAVKTSCWCSNTEHTHTYTVLLQQKGFLGTHVCMKFLPHGHTFFCANLAHTHLWLWH